MIQGRRGLHHFSRPGPVRAIAMIVLVLFVGHTTVLAQEHSKASVMGTPIVQATPLSGTPAILATPLADRLQTGATPDSGVSDFAGGTFESFGYDDVTAHGMHASTVMYFPLPRWSEGSGNGQLDLAYSHSPLLVPELSTMTVMINDQATTSVRLGTDTQEGGHLSIPLPKVDTGGSSLAVRFAFHLRLTREQCEVPDDPALWVTIHSNSQLVFAPQTLTSAPYLSDLPRLFRSGPIAGVRNPVFVLPERANAEELNAAGIVAHELGNWSGQSHEAPVLGNVSWVEPAVDTPAIFVGQGASLPVGARWGDLEWDGKRFFLKGVAVPPEAGVLAMRQQPVPQLLVSGGTPDAVLRAAITLVHAGPEYETSTVVVPGALTATENRQAWEEGAASFAQLGTNALEVVGPGEHSIDLEFERPAAWVLREGGTLQLMLDVSPAVRLETSWVRVTVNDLDIGSQPFRLSDESIVRYVFTLPAGRLNNDLDGQPVRDLSLKLRIYLDYPQAACETVDPLGVWASLLPTSAWILPHDTFEGTDIGRFPQGFVSSEETLSAAIVVPDLPTAGELQTALQVAAAIGRWDAMTASTAPQIYPAAAMTDEDLANHSLILIGGPDRNALAERADPTMLSALQPTAYTAEHTDDYGVLSLGTSPWDVEHSLLIVAGPFGTDDTIGMRSAALALGDSDLLFNMQGRGIVVPSALVSQILVGADPPNAAPADLAPYVIPEERPWIERIPAWQVVGTILTLTVVVLFLVVVFFRWIRRGAQ